MRNVLLYLILRHSGPLVGSRPAVLYISGLNIQIYDFFNFEVSYCITSTIDSYNMINKIIRLLLREYVHMFCPYVVHAP